MKPFGRHASAGLIIAIIIVAALGIAACSGNNKTAAQDTPTHAASPGNQGENDDSAGTDTREADTSRLGTFAVCAGLPRDYFGDAGDIPADQLKVEPKLALPAPQPVVMPLPPRATPMQTAFDTMWAKSIEAAATAESVEETLAGLRIAIVWDDMGRAGKLVAHLSDLLSRMAAAGKASRLAEAKLLRLEVAPLLQHNPPPMLDVDDPVGMQRAFVAWQQKLRRDGLPPEIVAKLERIGWTDEDIAAMTAGAIRAPAGQVVSQTIYGTVLAVANIRHYEQDDDKQAAAANAELDMLRKGVTDCGPTL